MITDTEARKIASDWHGGGGTALYALSSTGAINTARDDHDLIGELTGEISTLADEYPEAYPDRAHTNTNLIDLAALLTYIVETGPRGPVDGWAKLTW